MSEIVPLTTSSGVRRRAGRGPESMQFFEADADENSRVGGACREAKCRKFRPPPSHHHLMVHEP